MKYLLLICLLYTVLSAIVKQMDKVPIKELELTKVDETFKKAVELDNPNADISSLKLLNVYKDTVIENNYRMSFIDTNNKIKAVQEYLITDSSTPPQKKTYLPTVGFNVKPKILTKIKNLISKYINPNENLKIEMITTPLDYIYMAVTNSKTYIVSQNRKNLEFEYLGTLN